MGAGTCPGYHGDSVSGYGVGMGMWWAADQSLRATYGVSRVGCLGALLVARGGAPKIGEGSMPSEVDTGTAETVPTSTAPTGGPTDDGSVYVEGDDQVSVVVSDPSADPRTYTLNSSHPQRDDGPSSREVPEEAEGPVLRSGSLLFDALFAQAVLEARLNSVDAITDGAFHAGAPQPCRCFQTGELWTYVWTRDTAYAVDLGLGWLDPQRSADSLRFKLSEAKPGAEMVGPQLVQDTGTGGSWPISTDRVVWAIGAAEVLAWLPEPERAAFADEAYAALVPTLELDRIAVFDAADGLYRGEQSFLDWREQSYPSWTADDLVHIAQSKALSTNVGHHVALTLAADLAAERRDADAEARYRDWADALAAAVDARLWVDSAGNWSSFITTALDPTPTERWDWLGTSLASLHLGDPAHAARAVAAYPHGVHGPPVLAPQQPHVPIYHNRAIWPFVTAYGVRAARLAGNDTVFDRGAHSLVRGAALNLSNLENLEVLSGANSVDDGPYSGPVVNSRRQLWSVAGYLSLVTQGMFGLSASADGLSVDPFITRGLRRSWLGYADAVELRRFPVHGRSVDVVLELPPISSEDGHLEVRKLTVDGVPMASPIPLDALSPGSRIVVALGPGPDVAGAITELVDDGDFTQVFAPVEPGLHGLSADGEGVRLDLDDGGEAGVVLHVFRDGLRVAADLPGDTRSWVDSDVPADQTVCYAVASEFPGSGHRSQHTRPLCWWGADGARVQTVSAWRMVSLGGVWAEDNGRPHHAAWGEPGDELVVHGFQPGFSGTHWLQLTFANGAGPLNTGVTAGHKRLVVELASTGEVVAEGTVACPHTGGWDQYRDSSLVPAEFDVDEAYTLRVVDAPNMTSLAHFIVYTGGEGGGLSTSNHVDVAALKVLTVEALAAAPAPGIMFDGVDDLAAIPAEARLAPGVALAEWSAIGLAWDERNLYIAVVSPAFEEDFAPFVLYLEGDPGVSSPGIGLEVDGLVPALSFTPTHAITLRAEPGDDPWPGVWAVGPDGSYERRMRFEAGVDRHLAADRHTLSAVVPWAVLG
ncbi:MAG: hypothetical protein ACI9K2_007335, partial [Myxococcota bacterium]